MSIRRQESIYEMTGLYSETGEDDVPLESEVSDSCNLPDATATAHLADTVIKSHSRQPSSGLVDRDKSLTRSDDLTRDCGIFGCRPSAIQRFARIKVSTQFFLLRPLQFSQCVSFADIRFPSVHASHTTASLKFGLHKFGDYND